ncbi:MAG TPA: ascorbate-dependent monooxygenase [Thermoanaerobaculia bacterium]|nr:ascorbate-dependent monooxygenase [Thermoanaerobaculia bacterium]
MRPGRAASATLTTLVLALLALSGAATAGRLRPVNRSVSATPTFSNEVVRIFQANCQSCHHPGDIAPFSLMTYEDARPWAAMIRLMTSTRQMPPWKPAADCSRFEGERRLTDLQIATLARWVDAGAPEGDPNDLPPPLVFDGGWALGTPDLVAAMPTAYTPPGDHDMYRCFPLELNAERRWISAMDVRPGNRQIVHHVIAFVDTSGASLSLDAADPEPGYRCFGGPGFITTEMLGGWAPGARPAPLPAGVALELPANSRIVLQVHYHVHDDAHHVDPDRTEVALYDAEPPVQKKLRVLPLLNHTFTIPAGASDYEVTASFTVPPFYSAHAHAIAPHMHLLGRSMKVEAVAPTGATTCMVRIDDWDFNWQGMYVYTDPVPLPQFTTVRLSARYDNSSANPRNPNDPPKPVSWGEETTDEMCLAFIGVTFDAENLAAGEPVDASWIPPIPAGR